jgi:hypothetical protein
MPRIVDHNNMNHTELMSDYFGRICYSQKENRYCPLFDRRHCSTFEDCKQCWCKFLTKGDELDE